MPGRRSRVGFNEASIRLRPELKVPRCLIGAGCAGHYRRAGRRLGQSALSDGERAIMTTDDNRMPSGIPYIIANEFAERFCYYGINAVLAIYMTQFLHFGQARATSWQSLFKAGAYFAPL